MQSLVLLALRPALPPVTSPVSLYITGGFGVLLLLMGLRILLSPSAVADTFPLPTSSRSEAAYARLMGIRNMFTGGVFVMLAAMRLQQALGLALLMGVGISIVDGYIVMQLNGGAAKVASHWGASLFFLPLVYFMLSQ